MPAADIADNPYWRRDVRRAYPKLSAVTQGDVVGLLTMGNATAPSPRLLTGEEGSKQLVAVKKDGEKGLATYFESEKGAAVLGEGGLPPLPVSFGKATGTRYEVGEPAYKDKYVCAVLPKVVSIDLTCALDIRVGILCRYGEPLRDLIHTRQCYEFDMT